MVFEFMNDDNFGLEKELRDYAETVEMPSLYSDNVTAAEEYLDSLFSGVDDVVSKAEKYLAVSVFFVYSVYLGGYGWSDVHFFLHVLWNYFLMQYVLWKHLYSLKRVSICM